MIAPAVQEGLAPRDPAYGGDALMVHRIRCSRATTATSSDATSDSASRERAGDYGNALNPAFWRLTNARYLYTNARHSRQLTEASSSGPSRTPRDPPSTCIALPGRQPTGVGHSRLREGRRRSHPGHHPRPAVRSASRRGVRFHVERRRAGAEGAPRAARHHHASHPLRPRAHRARAQRAGAGGLGARRVGELLSRAGRRRSTDAPRFPRSARTTPSSAFRSRPVRRKSASTSRIPRIGRGKTVTIVASLLALAALVAGLLIDRRRVV